MDPLEETTLCPISSTQHTAGPPFSGPLVRACPRPCLWATLPGLLGAPCLTAQAAGPCLRGCSQPAGPSPRPSCAGPLRASAAHVLCQHQLEPNHGES